MNAFKKILFFFILFFGTGNLFSQQITVDAVIDTAKMRIGEQARVDIYVTYSAKQKDIKIEWPSIGDTLTGKVEVVSVSPIDTTFPDKTNSSKIFQHQQVIISVYDSGYFAIPGFKFILDNDTSHALYTNPLFLEVHTVPTDTSITKVKDIKAPFEEKFNWKWYLDYIYWGIAALIVIIATILITSYYARKNKKVVVEPEKPKIPAHIIALAILNKIKEEQVWKESKIKEYYSSISETIRAYIEDRFNVHAMESTTDEIMTAFRSQVVDKESKDKLQQLLTLSDLVKFAKMYPVEDEHNFTLQNAFDFVEGTKREEETQASEEEINEAANAYRALNSSLSEMKSTKKVAAENSAGVPLNSSEENELDLLEKKKAKNKKIKKVVFIGIPILIVLIVGFIFWNPFSSSSSGGSENPVLNDLVSSINKVCPVMVDAETRLDQAVASNENDVQFNCTFVNIVASEVDVNALKEQAEPLVMQQVLNNPQLKPLKNAKAIIKFSYNDKGGNFLFSIKITPEDYNTYY